MTLIGTALLVAASNTLNMYLERDVDALMERTRDRPLPRAACRPRRRWRSAPASSASASPLVFLGGNPLTGLLGLLARLRYVAVYTPLKRHSAAALFVGAVPGAMPPLMGWTAVTGHLDAPGLALFADAVPLADPALPGHRDLPRRRLRARRLQGAAADRVRARHARPIVALLGRRSSRRRSCSSRCTWPARATRCAPRCWARCFIGWAAAGSAAPRENRWARSLFLFSIVYLTLLFVGAGDRRTVHDAAAASAAPLAPRRRRACAPTGCRAVRHAHRARRPQLRRRARRDLRPARPQRRRQVDDLPSADGPAAADAGTLALDGRADSPPTTAVPRAPGRGVPGAEPRPQADRPREPAPRRRALRPVPRALATRASTRCWRWWSWATRADEPASTVLGRHAPAPRDRARAAARARRCCCWTSPAAASIPRRCAASGSSSPSSRRRAAPRPRHHPPARGGRALPTASRSSTAAG